MTKTTNQKYRTVIGLEIHAQLLTQSKIFSDDSTAFGQPPNTNISVITLAHPGTLPRLNRKVVELAIRMGLACHCQIARQMIFDRKNYFYPDLPKGYQVTQDRTPVCKGGHVVVPTANGNKKVRLHKIHLEEDAGKSIHSDRHSDTLVDLNRAGVPLIEIVTEPDLSSSEEAAALLTEIRKMVRYLDVCDGNMEEGSLRCDANISIMPADAKELGNKVEIKNMNSIKNVQKAIDYEISRQVGLAEKGEVIISETRLYNASNGRTFSMRTKEQLTDYRYFPEPDLSPFVIEDQWIESIRNNMPALPQALQQELQEKYQLPLYDAAFIAEDRSFMHFFKQTSQFTANYKAICNWIMGPIKSLLNDKNASLNDISLQPEKLAGLINLIDDGKVNFTTAAQIIFPRLMDQPDLDPEQIAQQEKLLQQTDSASLQPVIEEVLKAYPQKVKQYQKGKKGLIGFFMGEVMKKTKGKADPKLASQLLSETLKR
ncbi:MAG: Asp-tRNA(Asn)/Glu-tRNA(Gln) amidotransferase subunit GatB [Candidatus Cyclobacteriaceae bacterium M3_2C_046]